MKIEFHAANVIYTEAIDGEIVQVTFEEEEDSNPLHPTKRYLQISANYEFGSRRPTAEWFDGNDENGGMHVTFFHIGENKARIQLENAYRFNIRYEAAPSVIDNIRSFLARDCREINA